MKAAFALLPIANAALECLSHVFESQTGVVRSATCRRLWETASVAFRNCKVETKVAYTPFDIFWSNPDEPRHSRLLKYFIDPEEGHNCGIVLLRGLLKAFRLREQELPVDSHCKVTREDQHIDLLITRNKEDGNYAVIIENKVNGARDQYRQLQTYYDVLLKRGFKDKEIFVCYLPLRHVAPSEDSRGNIKELHIRSFDVHIVSWLETALRNKETCSLQGGMLDNLRHYLDLIKWKLNQEKITQMNEQIFDVLRKLDRSNELPKLEEIMTLKESAQALEKCYRRFVRAKTFGDVRHLLEERDLKVSHSDSTRNGWANSPLEDDLISDDYWFGISIGDLVIVALGAEDDKIYAGYGVPSLGDGAAPARTDEMKRFENFVRKEEPSLFCEHNGTYWYSYFYLGEIDCTGPDDRRILADKMFDMCQRMKRLVSEFTEVTKRRESDPVGIASVPIG